MVLQFCCCNNNSTNGKTDQEQILKINPEQSYSGETAVITLPAVKGISETSLSVYVKEIPADIVSVDSQTVVFLIPEIEPGKISIRLEQEKKIIGRTQLTILPHPNRKLVFGLDGNEMKIIGDKFTNEPAETVSFNNATATISFELRNPDNNVVTQGAIINQTGSLEIFADPSGKITRKDSLPSTFSIIIPNQKGSHKLYFYKNRMQKKLSKAGFTKKLDNPWQVFNIQN